MKHKTEFGYHLARMDRCLKNLAYVREDITRLQASISRVSSRVTLLEKESIHNGSPSPGNESKSKAKA